MTHTFFREHRDEIVAEWEALASSGACDVPLAGSALRDNLPEFLDDLADWLERDDPERTERLCARASGHAVQRLDRSFRLPQLLREFALLRGTILRRLLREGPQERAPPDAAPEGRAVELTRLNAGLDLALSEAVSHFIDQRDRRAAELRRAQEDALHASQEDLRASEERFRTLADNIAQLTWMADGKGSITWFNKRWFDYTGTTLEEVRGWGWRKVHHPDHVDRVAEKLQRCFEAGVPWEDSFPLRGRDGAYRWFLCRAFPIRDASGRVARWFGSATDVTELREAQEALRVADRRKTEFLAILSHELRNCLAPMGTGMHLLERAPPGSARADRAREIIRRQMDHVARLVDDLLDISRIDAGKIRIERTRFDARGVVRRACEDVRAAFEERGIALELEVASGPLWIHADEARLAQIAGNLLGNALKFTPRSGTVRVSVLEEAGAMALRVRDSGAGIEPRFLEEIFEPFTQAERTEGTAHGGMGIGLALVRSLVTMQGGDVRARSEGKGKGAELVVRLPLVAAPEAGEPRPRPALDTAIPSLDILVVDDNRDAAETLDQLLQLEGHRTRLAFDGTAGLEAFRERAPDVFLSDVGLPDVSGYELVRAIRGLEGGGAAFAVALTGYAQADDVERAREAGFDAHLPKPAPLQRLHELLGEAAARRAERAAAGPPPSAAADDGGAPGDGAGTAPDAGTPPDPLAGPADPRG